MADITTPRIYVSSLSDYAAGTQLGTWIELGHDVTEDDVCDQIAELLQHSSHDGEEWAIHDYEGFGALNLGEYERLKDVVWWAQVIDEHGTDLGSALIEIAADRGTTPQRVYEEAYEGKWDSFRHYAEELFDELYPSMNEQQVLSYVDYESFARDLEMGGEYNMRQADDYSGVFVFSQ